MSLYSYNTTTGCDGVVTPYTHKSFCKKKIKLPIIISPQNVRNLSRAYVFTLLTRHEQGFIQTLFGYHITIYRDLDHFLNIYFFIIFYLI